VIEGFGYSNLHMSPTAIVFLICMVTIVFPYFVIVFQFMYIGAFDVARHLEMMKVLQSMIRIRDTSKSIDIDFKISRGEVAREETFLEREVLDRRIKKRRVATVAVGSSAAAIRGSSSQVVRGSNISVRSSSTDTTGQIAMAARGSIDPEAMMNPSASLEALEEADKASSTTGMMMRTPVMKSMEADFESTIPQLKLNSRENLLGWTYSYLVLYNFGQRFSFRLATYSTLIIIIFVALIAAIFINLFTSTSHEKKIEVFISTFFRQSMLAVTLIFIYLLILSFNGSNFNASVDDAMATLTAQSLKNVTLITELEAKLEKLHEVREVTIRISQDQDKLNRMKLAIEKMDRYLNEVKQTQAIFDNCREAIRQTCANDPFTVLGIEVQAATVTSVLSLAFGFYLAIYRIYDPEAANSVSIFD
jgi:hypothetical protein